MPGRIPDTKKKTVIVFAFAAVILTVVTALIVWGNTALQINTYTVTSAQLPNAFDGFRIAHVSDLHNAEMGEGNESLLAMLREAAPDIIAITGDLIDSRHTGIAVALQFAEEAMTIAPCYFVSGNHEARVPAYSALREGLRARGVIVLENAREEIEIGGERLTLLGVTDPAFSGDFETPAAAVVETALSSLADGGDGYTVLLSHRPELFSVYVACGMDLVMSGHAHGGQFRLPLIGGLVAPNQGIFPKYDAGLYTEANTSMIVSRGIGNSLFPFRLNNRPEVVLIELQTEAQ